MNKDLNLAEILKDCPKGTRLYSPMFGEVELVEVEQDKKNDYPIIVKAIYPTGDSYLETDSFAANGVYYKEYGDSECLLFPSKDQRDWSKFEAPIPDKALVWCWERYDLCQRTLKFYDAINQSTFSKFSGRRDGIAYDNYELFQGEEPAWAKEARKNLGK